MRLKFGVHTGLQETTFDELIPLWRQIESLGFHWISVWDHIYPTLGVTDGRGPNLDSIVAMTALASATEQVRIGCLVFNATLRHPALLANAAAAIDQLSGGRLEFGIGAGWNEDEQVDSGIPYPGDGVRVSMLEEAIESIRLLWTEDSVRFEGRYFSFDGARCDPKPVQVQPRIWVGGFRPRVLGIIGRKADGFNSPYVAPAIWESAWGRVRSAAETAGRDSAEITPSVNVGVFLDRSKERAGGRCAAVMGPQVASLGGHLLGSTDDMAEMVGQYRAAGVEQLNIVLRPPFDVEALHAVAEVVAPQFADGGFAADV